MARYVRRHAASSNVFVIMYMLLVYCIYLLALTSTIAAFNMDISRLLVATVLDLAEPEIVRDTYTLIRSIRLHGGSLNQAQIVVCVPISNNISYIFDESHHLAGLAALGVEFKFYPQVERPLHKTVNKFGAFFALDTYTFDYFLWLDADIVVFQDPLPHFNTHILEQASPLNAGPSSTGTDSRTNNFIYCVPDIFSYMIRYPGINTSSAFWNPFLSTFEPVGDEEGE
jgi:hypothetical protein